ncbi:transcriptional regulator, TetR family [Lampropedia hyalina DSM 16112]|jgi:AcrR family transcriptional regulator|uniref:Transcriptional regulator, TetR family n=1 Tax=Lampropedia hyalina DSM 16112 TaxID=1122156 RepID=A0A1M5ECV6_9BURK|nr:TetR/AcrR family transcriptional regulator [Lampropedia hyalina]SHF77027.1 transcriptional regulator, TetR family [Lampropedia hyalina DSM 16112]
MNRKNQQQASPTRLSREESQARTREGLIQAATRLFAEKGYGGTSIRDIAEQSGHSQGAFYSNFHSKEELLLEMLRQHMQAEAVQLNTLVEQKQRSPAEILDDLEAWASALDQDPHWCMLSIELQLHAQRSATFAAAYQAVWLQHRDVLAQWMARLFAERQLQMPAAPQDIASTFMALAHGLALQRAATGSGASGRLMVVLLRGLMALSA